MVEVPKRCFCWEHQNFVYDAALVFNDGERSKFNVLSSLAIKFEKNYHNDLLKIDKTRIEKAEIKLKRVASQKRKFDDKDEEEEYYGAGLF